MKSFATVSKVGAIHVIRATMDDVSRALIWGGKNKGGKLPAYACSVQRATDWYDNYSHAAMRKLMIDGDASLITDVLADLDLAISDEAQQHEITRAPLGFFPCVPAAIAMQPDSMYTLRIADTSQRKALTLFYNVGFPGGTSSHIVREYGHEVMKIVNQLHAERIDVNLYGYVYCGGTNAQGGNVLTVIEVQRSQDVFTPERIAATLPSSFCRRGIFGLWEHLAYHADSNQMARGMCDTSYGTHDRELEIFELKDAMPDLDTDSIVLMPSISVHVNPAQIWEPINLKLGRETT